MNTQTPTNPVMICNFVVALPEADYPSDGSLFASSLDYGFDFDEDELARELLAPLPAAPAAPFLPEVDADEFENAFQYY